MKYHNKQIAKAIISIIVSSVIFILALSRDIDIPVLLICLLLGLITFLFSSLTISISDNKMSWYFGPMFLKNEIALKDIQTVKIIRTKWYYGFGICLLDSGKLYNVSGLDAIEIKLKNRTVTLGTNQPNELFQAINKHLTRT